MTKKILLGLSTVTALFLNGCTDDTKAPEFYISDVKYGVVSGIIKDETSAGININGTIAKAKDPSPKGTDRREQLFSLTGLNLNADIFTLYAEDGSSNKNRSAALQLANKNKVFNDAISMQINQSGIDYMADALADFMQTVNIKDMLDGDDNSSTEPFYIYRSFLVDYDFFASKDETEYSIVDPVIHMTSIESDGDGTMKMYIDATFPEINIGVKAVGIIDFDLTPKTSATLTGSVILSKNDKNEIIATTEDIDLTLGAVDVGLTSFETANEVLGSFIKESLEGNLTTILDDNISSILTDTFASIPFENNDIAINEKLINFSLLPVELNSKSNALTLMMNAHSKAVTIDPALKGALGSLFVDKRLTIADNSENYDISTVVSANMLNQLLLASYQSGATTLTGEISGFDYVATSQAPAYITFGTANGNIGQFVVPRIKADLTDGNNVTTHAVATITVDIAPNTVGVEDGKLIINLEQAKIDIDILSINDAKGFGTELVEEIVNLLLPTIIPDLTNALNELPLPDLVGYSINIQETAATAANKAHLLLAGDMISIDRTLAATAPDTYATLAMSANSANSADGIKSNTPIVLLLSGENPTDEPLQYRYQIDSGNWSVWTKEETATLNNLTEGSHTATVCARTFEMKVDPTCEEISFYK